VACNYGEVVRRLRPAIGQSRQAGGPAPRAQAEVASVEVRISWPIVSPKSQSLGEDTPLAAITHTECATTVRSICVCKSRNYVSFRFSKPCQPIAYTPPSLIARFRRPVGRSVGILSAACWRAACQSGAIPSHPGPLPAPGQTVRRNHPGATAPPLLNQVDL
jgi:hypothetical protein